MVDNYPDDAPSPPYGAAAQLSASSLVAVALALLVVMVIGFSGKR